MSSRLSAQISHPCLLLETGHGFAQGLLTSNEEQVAAKARRGSLGVTLLLVASVKVWTEGREERAAHPEGQLG